MTYTWGFYNTLHNIAQGKADVGALVGHYYEKNNSWPRDGMRMTFVSNHDKNAWDGTEFEAFGEALRNAIVLSFVSEGMPLIYNGQEAGNPKRLAFFEKDPIEWREHPLGELYRELIALKKGNTALWNGRWGAPMIQVPTTTLAGAPAAVFSFVRANDKDKVFAVFNFSGEDQQVSFSSAVYEGHYRDFASGESVVLGPELSLALPAWSHRVFIQ
jgi:glycosidase